MILVYLVLVDLCKRLFYLGEDRLQQRSRLRGRAHRIGRRRPTHVTHEAGPYPQLPAGSEYAAVSGSRIRNRMTTTNPDEDDLAPLPGPGSPPP